MTPENIEKRVQEIRGCIWDNASAHMMEDLLLYDVLKAIAEGTTENPKECAAMTLTVYAIEYDRWYA